MTDDAPAALEDFDRRAGHGFVNLGARMLARHRVVMAANIAVKIDTDPHCCPFGIFVAAFRQQAQVWPVQLGNGAGASARQLLEQRVQVGQQGEQSPVTMCQLVAYWERADGIQS